MNWRLLAKRQWPLALSLTAIAISELTVLSTTLGWWQIPGVLVICTISVLAPRRPFDAALALALAIVCVALYLRFLGVAFSRTSS